MLTIKKRTQPKGVLCGIVALLILTACAPPGQRALVKGDALLRAGKYNEAISKLEQAAQVLEQEKPDLLPQTLNLLGLAYHHSGQISQAEESYEKAFKLDRDLAEARYNLGCLLLEKHDLARAADQLNTYIQLRSKEADGFLRLGAVYLQAADLTSGPERNRQLDYARMTYENAQRVSPTAEGFNALGVIQIERYRNASDALARFKEALHQETNYPPALLNMAIVYHEYLNDRRQALQKYREYLAVQPRPANAKEIESLAQTLQQDMNSGARTTDATPPAVRQAPRVLPPADPAPASAGKRTKTGSSPPKAESPPPQKNTATPVAATDPGPGAESSPQNDSPSPATVPVAIARASTGIATTVENPEKSAAGNRREAERLIVEGTQAQQTGRSAEAMQKYRAAVKADPSCFDACLRMGLCAQETGNLPASLEALQHAVALKPDSSNARYAFAWSLQKAGSYKESASELEKLLSKTPGDVPAHLLLGNLYAQQLKQRKLAREHYQKVLEAEPHHPQATAIYYWLTANP